MSADWLDLLLARETRATPLAEPRIDSSAPSMPVDPDWGETVEDTVVAEARGGAPRTRPPAADRPAAPAPQGQAALTPTPTLAAEWRVAPVTESGERPSVSPPRETEEAPARTSIDKRDDAAQRLPAAPALVEARIVDARAPAPTPTPLDRRTVFPPARAENAAPRDPRGERLFDRAAHADASPEPPRISIRIDRLEVRAAVPPSAAATTKQGAKETPRLSLDDYLARRKGGGR
jgi:hypothetical protein